jgi:hypothetical protein
VGRVEGPDVHIAELTAQEKHVLWMELGWLKDGHRTWEVTDDALVLTNDDTEIVIPYADIEESTAA